ncbi:MAG: TetR/AcrR family transcriptional regulator [Actinomycetia bacterium]|nr:TetR/AcrR family transcriptional regulator [Actinomycetes bacterium]
MGVRDEARAETVGRILTAARAQIAEHGGVGLSMRAVARESGLVSSAVYRYFATREALLTAMILESYEHLAAALAGVTARRPDRRWQALARRFRDWAREHPHEFQLIYGTPIPGYVAPPETVPAAAAVAAPFLALAAHPVETPAGAARPAAAQRPGQFGGATLRRQLAIPAAELGVSPVVLGAVLAELAALVGVIGLELAGHFVGTADPADHLFEALLDRQVHTLAL